MTSIRALSAEAAPRATAALLALSPAVCPGPSSSDAGDPPPTDSGSPNEDAGQPPVDAGQPPDDAGQPPIDAGQPPVDAGQPPTDAGTPTDQATLIVTLQSAGAISVHDAVVTVADQQHVLNLGSHTLSGLTEGESVVQVRAPGFAPAAYPVTLVGGRTSYATLALLPVAYEHTFNSNLPALVKFEGTQVTLPPNALVNNVTGLPVSGDVTAHITPFDALTSPTLLPGSLSTEDNGALDSLNSFAMADITFTQSGEELQLAPFTTAEIRLLIDEARIRLDSGAPIAPGDQIPAWSYDLAAGRWVNEGMGTVQLNAAGQAEWVLNASHFAWWNSDDNATFGEGATCIFAKLVGEVTGDEPDDYRMVVRGMDGGGGQVQPQHHESTAGYCFNVPKDTENVICAGFEAPENFLQVTSGDSDNLCATATFFDCDRYELTYVEPNCVSGRVLVDGQAEAGVVVTGVYYDHRTQAATDDNGEYCLSIPPNTPAEVRASTLGDDGRLFKETQRINVVTPDGPATCSDGDCMALEDINLTEEDIFCIKGTATDSAGAPVPAGYNYYLFGDDGFPTYVHADQPPEQWQADYLYQRQIGPGGSYCIDVPVDAGGFEMVLDNGNTPMPLCDQEAVFYPICAINSEQIPVAGWESLRGTSCAKTPDECKVVDVVFDED